jgi:hypothetical protein
MTLVIEIGALILGAVFVLVYTIDKLIEWSAYFEQKEEEEKQDQSLREISKHLYR